MPYPTPYPVSAFYPRYIIASTLRQNQALLRRKRNNIYFEVDYNGKALLNNEIFKLRDNHLIISKPALADIVTSSIAIIDKMIVLKTCGWSLEQLHAQLEEGVAYWINRSGYREW